MALSVLPQSRPGGRAVRARLIAVPEGFAARPSAAAFRSANDGARYGIRRTMSFEPKERHGELSKNWTTGLCLHVLGIEILEVV